MRVYVGADWSASEIVVATLTDDEQKPRRVGKTNRTIADVQALVGLLRSRYPESRAIHVVVESGAPGWVEMLHEAGAVVHIVDAKQAKRFAESLSSSGAKDDVRDAAVLARLCQERWARLDVWSPDDPFHMQLRALSRTHEVATRHCTQVQQRLRSLLSETFPSLNAVLHDVRNQWVHRLLRVAPTRVHAKNLSRAEFDIAMKGTRMATRQKVWSCLQSAGTLQLDKQRAETLKGHVHWLLDDIEHFARRLAVLEQQLDELTAEFEPREALESVPGIGMKLAARLLLFVFHRTPSHRDEAGVVMGACPVFDGSGTTDDGRSKGITKMRRASGSRERETSYLLGRLAVQRIPWASARYAYDRARNKNAATIYRSVARSLLRVLTALVKSGEEYDDARYVARLKANGVPWAVSL